MRSCSSSVRLSCRILSLKITAVRLVKDILQVPGSLESHGLLGGFTFCIEVLYSVLGLLRGPGWGFSLLFCALVAVCLWFPLGLPQLSLMQTVWSSLGETCMLWRLNALGLLLLQVCQNFWLPKRAFLGVTAGICLTTCLSGPWAESSHLVHWWCQSSQLVLKSLILVCFCCRSLRRRESLLFEFLQLFFFII
jgi:hypothetical protein